MREITRPLGLAAGRPQIDRVRAVAAAYDVAKGPPHVAERCGCGCLIQLWCRPDDRPSTWDVPFRLARLRGTGGWGPCELVGDFDWDVLGLDHQGRDVYRGLVRVYARALNDWRGRQAVERWTAEGGPASGRPYPGGGRWHLSPADEAACLDWLEHKARGLLRLAELAPVVVGTRCPWCSWVLYRGELLNGILDHVAAAHPGVDVRGLVLSDPPVLQTAGGDVPLLPAEQFMR